MVFMSLMNLRPRAIRPIDRRPLPFRAERGRRVANELWVRRAIGEGVRCRRTPSAFALGATIHH
jgi:hypothetical protein